MSKAPTILLVILLAGHASAIAALSQRDGEFGPAVESFLEYCRHEENELDFQIKHGEIGRAEYRRSKNRIAVWRESVLQIVRRTKTDVVPDLNVVTVDELEALIEGDAGGMDGLRPGTVIHDKWRFIGKVRRGEIFYVFQRLTKT